MKREFLQNFQVAGQPMTKEIIDAIMEENGRDINAAKAPFADYETVKQQLTAAQGTIEQLKKDGTSLEDVQKKAAEWEKKFNEAQEEHRKAMEDRDFHDRLNAAVTKAQGRNAKAIAALLDLDALKGSKDQEKDIAAALEACKKDNGYLFGEEKTPPPYAGGTGASGSQGAPKTTGGLAGALADWYNT